MNKSEISKVYICQNDEKVEQKCSLADFCSVSDALTPWLLKGVLKQCLLCIQGTTFLGVNDFGNT